MSGRGATCTLWKYLNYFGKCRRQGPYIVFLIAFSFQEFRHQSYDITCTLYTYMPTTMDLIEPLHDFEI